MRKKFVKSSRPTYKKRIKKAQQGMRFASYNVVETPRVELTDITNPINPFSEYNYNTTYDKPEALVVPVRDTNETDVVVDKPTVEPVINKPVASNPVTTNSTWKSPYKDRSKWVTDLTSAYKRAGITNDNAIKMLLAQDALESSWGKSAQGKYNFGNLTTGAKWKGDYVTGNDKNAKGEAIKQKFRSYNSMDEYAADKIQFLKRLYDFDENDDISKFVAKLTGSNKGKRRYAEATNYAKVLTGVYNGIPKGQNGLVINRDAIKDYRPNMPIAPTKQRYMPTQQPMLSPDNRTGWEKEVSRQIKADRAKNDNLYGNQHTWNWSAPFTNARMTKDNASAMFDFDKSAAMSTFAIGQGIANPVATGVSIAGSLVGAGIGKQVAGEKGALVGGFVGGMVNPKAVKTVTNTLGDEYTTIGGRFGYYGNPVQRVWHTVGRNRNWNVSAKHPELMRKLEEPIKVNPDGTLQVTNPNPRFGTPITNFTTDRPVVPHSAGNWDMNDLYIFDPKITKGMKPASIEPSDTFYPDVNVTAKPSQTTLVSGNVNSLTNARSKGMSTLSSKKARKLYEEADNRYNEDLRAWSDKMKVATGATRRSLESEKPVRNTYGTEYAKEIQRLQSKRGTPTMKDYKKWEHETGLKAGVTDENVIPALKQYTEDIKNAFDTWDYDFIDNSKFRYPNGRTVDNTKLTRELEMLESRPYNKVYYDPATWAEFNYKNKRNIK